MNLEIIERIDRLIRLKVGNANDIASKLEITERSIYNYIKYMKTELEAPIAYDSSNKTYLYSERGRLDFKWKKEI
jgi:predicted transcriptional regulator